MYSIFLLPPINRLISVQIYLLTLGRGRPHFEENVLCINRLHLEQRKLKNAAYALFHWCKQFKNVIYHLNLILLCNLFLLLYCYFDLNKKIRVIVSPLFKLNLVLKSRSSQTFHILMELPHNTSQSRPGIHHNLENTAEDRAAEILTRLTAATYRAKRIITARAPDWGGCNLIGCLQSCYSHRFIAREVDM